MLNIYGSLLSSPTNKVRYVANYLAIPYEFHRVNLGAAENRQPEFLKINPMAKIPAIEDAGFTLGESNAIIRYLADKQQSALYPRELQQRAVVDQWIDHASQHIGIAVARIIYNTHFYKFKKVTPDERAIHDARQYLAQDLPVLEWQLSKLKYIADNKITLADFALLAALDASELSNIDLTVYPHLFLWRKNLMQETFYTKCHSSYTETLTTFMEKISLSSVA